MRIPKAKRRKLNIYEVTCPVCEEPQETNSGSQFWMEEDFLTAPATVRCPQCSNEIWLSFNAGQTPRQMNRKS